jgi:dTDP-4-dehydrorhamnose 3,5-epimerase-like enzyme
VGFLKRGITELICCIIELSCFADVRRFFCAFLCEKVFENLIELQKDVSLSVQEVTKMQKVYKEEEHVAHDARIKAADADDK